MSVREAMKVLSDYEWRFKTVRDQGALFVYGSQCGRSFEMMSHSTVIALAEHWPTWFKPKERAVDTEGEPQR